jgi:hypothetical protein
MLEKSEEGMKLMKKYVIGILIGFCLSFAVGAHAEVINMIGKVVDGTIDLTINKKKMEYQAVLIDGTTYAPVRMLGEETGYIVKFDDVTGVKLIKKITTPKETVLKSIAALNSTIATNESMTKGNQEEIVKLKVKEQTPQVLMDIKTTEDTIDRLQKGIVGLNEQIDKLNQTLADIDAQQAELNK